jgi:hypothetical protein
MRHGCAIAEVEQDLRWSVMHRRNIVRIVIAAALLGSAVLIGIVDRAPQPGRKTGGPLSCPECGRTEAGVPVSVGLPVSYGAVHLTNGGSEPAVLEHVSLLGADPAMKLVGVMILEIGREPAVGLALGYPPKRARGTSHSVIGYTLPPPNDAYLGVLVVVGAKIIANGRHRFRRIAVDYRVRDRHYRALFDSSLVLCAPPSISTSKCAGADLGRKRTASTATSESPP